MVALVIASTWSTVFAADSGAGGCVLAPTFEPISRAIPDVVGDCLDTAGSDARTGDVLQPTTGGLLVRRTSDTVVAFTDGYRTWLVGPNGLQMRLNVEQFDWEAMSSQQTGSVIGHVRATAAAGASAGGAPRPDTELGPVVGLIVRARTPDGTEVGSSVTDASGDAKLALPPGRYWIYAPFRQSLSVAPGAPVVGANIPTGEPVLAWVPVDVTSSATSRIELIVRIARP